MVTAFLLDLPTRFDFTFMLWLAKMSSSGVSWRSPRRQRPGSGLREVGT